MSFPPTESPPSTNPPAERLQPFSFVNLERRTDDYLTQIRNEAQRIAAETRDQIVMIRREAEEKLAAARTELERQQEGLLAQEKMLTLHQVEAERAFQQQRDAGYAAGLTAGREAGYVEGLAMAKETAEEEFVGEKESRLQSLTDEMRPTLCGLTTQLADLRSTLLHHWEENVLHIAAAIAHQAMGRELSAVPELPLELLRESLELAVGTVAVKIRMNPSDLDALRPQIESLLKEFTAMATVELVADARITPGGSIVETGSGTIDQRLEVRIDRIIAELSSQN